MKQQISELYFEWLLRTVKIDQNHMRNYTNALKRLYAREFYSNVRNDENRIYEGLDLRRIFFHEVPCSEDFWNELYPYCTVLEMMVALAIRCEQDIMYDPNEGDRTDIWFWKMFSNLQLALYPDENYDADEVDSIVDIFLDRKYTRNGEGGLFPLRHSFRNQRYIELWYQLNYYAEENWI